MNPVLSSYEKVNSLGAAMEARSCFVLILLVVQVVFSGQWITSAEENMSVGRKFPNNVLGNQKPFLNGNSETKKRIALPNNRDLRKKPSGHLTALSADDMENDGVISVAIGPSPSRPKYNRTRKPPNKNNNTARNNRNNNNVVNIVKDVLSQLGKEFLSRQPNEDFVFGQYVGNSMKNLTRETKLRMQHEILDLIVKYQKIDKGDITENDVRQKEEDRHEYVSIKESKAEKKSNGNTDTEEPWPDFTNLAKIVG